MSPVLARAPGGGRRASFAVRLGTAALCACLTFGCSNTREEQLSVEEYFAVVKALGSYEVAERRDAVLRIKSHPRAPTVAALKELLRTGELDLRVKVHVAYILATWTDPATQQGDCSGVPELVEGLRAPESDLRTLARETLHLCGAEAVSLVADVLRSGQKVNRVAAAEVLGEVLAATQDRRAAEALKARMRDEQDWEVRGAVVIAFARWLHAEAIGGLIDALTDPDDGIRHFAWAEVSGRASPPITFDPMGPVSERSSAVQKLRAWWGSSMN